jgi:hypothetical protein
MMRKIASVEPIGINVDGAWQKTASTNKIASNYVEGNIPIDIEGMINRVADVYCISRDPRNYLFIPARAVSSDVPNSNLDFFADEELTRFNPQVGMRVYSTFIGKPHFVNHNASNYKWARGFLVDSSYNNLNKADDETKKAVFEATGKEVDTDNFVECLIGVDCDKDPLLASAYKDGSVDKFSMGCDVGGTECSACGNVATNMFQFCGCIKNKHARNPVRHKDGSYKVAFEKCLDVVFAELSGVDDPADKKADVQDGILKAASLNNITLSSKDILEISNYVQKNASNIPDSIANILSEVLIHQN